MNEPKHTIDDLRQMQSMPLEAKVIMTQNRIRQWYEHWDGQVYEWWYCTICGSQNLESWLSWQD